MTVTDRALQLIELGSFFAAMIAFLVCGCIFTRPPAKKPQSTPQEEIKAVEPPLDG
jgi:hypothetical protein